jgi:hypothetical protein
LKLASATHNDFSENTTPADGNSMSIDNETISIVVAATETGGAPNCRCWVLKSKARSFVRSHDDREGYFHYGLVCPPSQRSDRGTGSVRLRD